MTPCPVCERETCHYWNLRQTETWHPVPVKPADLPAGFAESTAPGILHVKAGLGNKQAQTVLDRIEQDGFPSIKFDIPDGEIFDAGIGHYGEFYCSLSYAKQLLEDGLTIDGKPGTVSVVHRYTNGAQMKWTPS